MFDLKEKCGVFGIYGKGLDVSRLSFFGLFALQHRGQESSGIAVSDGTTIDSYVNVGLVTHVYSEDVISRLQGHVAIGHNRYSTSKSTGLLHAQPIVENGIFAFAHNGNLPSTVALEKFLKSKNLFHDELNDSEMMVKTIAYWMSQGKDLKQSVIEALPLFTGAFSLVIMGKDTLIAVRDRCGIRPLSIGKLNGGFVFASETCAFNAIGAELIRDVKPGEMIVVDDKGMESVQVMDSTPKFDIFEFVYFARPDSVLLGKSVYDVRRNCGLRLAEEYPMDADIIVPVPETAIPVAIGYSRATKIPLEMALVKNRYIHRTFIQPDQHSRDLGVKLKLTPLPQVLAGKRVILVDDSIVRGTTSQQIVKAIFEAGAIEVHFIVSSPPIRFPDFYGIDTPKQEKLIASRMTVEEIRKFLGATSLHYLSLDGLIHATGLPAHMFSLSCFTGEYPIDIGEREKEISRVVGVSAPSFQQPLITLT